MHIQFQAPGIGSFSSNLFQDQSSFLKSLGTGSDFNVYEMSYGYVRKKDILLKALIKKLRIMSVEPLNKDDESPYLNFTCQDSENKDIAYTGIICWD